MNKQDLINKIKSSSYTKDDLVILDKLIEKYPYFNIPRFIKLKAYKALDADYKQEELLEAAVYSSDRKHLYEWIQGEIEYIGTMQNAMHSELEFLDENSNSVEALTPADNTFELVEDDFDPLDDETESKAIPQKEELEIDENEIEENNVVPIIDNLEEEDVLEDGELIEADTDPGNAKDNKKEEALPTRNSEMDLLLRNTVTEEHNPNPEKSNGLIERFLKHSPGVIKADKETSLEGDVSMGSVEEDDSFITDTLAKIYVKQGLHAKAIYAYERLSLKYPEKSAYFAAQIEKIKNSTNT